MDGGRIGRILRALRHRRGWTQADLGRRAGCHRSVVSRLERGNVRACSLSLLERLFAVLDASIALSVRWRGGELDRLLDADHSRLAEAWAALRPARWDARSEVTYNVYGDRGSIDELAYDAATATLLVVELKTGIYDAGRTVAKIDEKTRVARGEARRFAWSVRRVVPALVVVESTTNRRRVEAHSALFGRFACRGRGAREWLRHPSGSSPEGLLLFISSSDVRGRHVRRAGRQRVRHLKHE